MESNSSTSIKTSEKSPDLVFDDTFDDDAIATLESNEIFDWIDELSRTTAEKAEVSFVPKNEIPSTSNKSAPKVDPIAEYLLATDQLSVPGETDFLGHSTFLGKDSIAQLTNKLCPGMDQEHQVSCKTKSSNSKNEGETSSSITSNLDSPVEHQTVGSAANACDNADGSIYKTPKNRIQEVPENIVIDVETTPKKVRRTPLPLLNWADNEEIWQNIVYKEEATLNLRNHKIFDTRSAYLPRIRAILLDWIMEVCDVYHLRRNTYYLAVDYIDRYLSIKPGIPKTQLQLLGISCLFVAAKLEEIYPPKLSEFSYVCDGACSEDEILSCEILLLNALGWELNPLTPSGWLNLYMQIHHNSKDLKHRKKTLSVDSHFQYPQYSGYQFVRASHIMDLFSMDPAFLRYSYSTTAAAAIFFNYGKRVSLAVSGLKWRSLKPCVSYMAVFERIMYSHCDPRLASVIPETVDARLTSTLRYLRNSIPEVVPDENHCIQTHLMDLDYYEKSVILRIQQYGLEVGKVYIRKIKTDSGDVEYESFSEPVENSSTPSVMLYELTPAKENLRPGSPEAPALHPTDPEYELGKVNIFMLRQKTVVAFDDILASVHNDSHSAVITKPLVQLSESIGYR